MNRAFSVKSLLVAVLAISGAATAAEHAAAPAKADAAKGARQRQDCKQEGFGHRRARGR